MGKQQAKWRAYWAVKYAVATGKIKRPSSCQWCGRRKEPDRDGNSQIHAHHYNGYAKSAYLDVVWLCPDCHNSAKIRKEASSKAKRENVVGMQQTRKLLNKIERERVRREHTRKERGES